MSKALDFFGWNDPGKYLFQAKKIDELRQKLRMKGLRFHPMYCRGSSRMQVIPLLASTVAQIEGSDASIHAERVCGIYFRSFG